MRKVKQLLESWKENASEPRTAQKFAVHLSLHDAARIQALAELFPGRTQEQIITELLSAALDEIEESLPYIQGKNVIAEDEFGDPVYEDVGPTPGFEAATRKHYQSLVEKLEKTN